MPIEYLSIEGINKLDISILEKYKNLKTISIDMEDAENFTEEIKALQESRSEEHNV